MKKGEASYKDRYLMVKKQYDELERKYENLKISEAFAVEEVQRLEQRYNALLSTTESNE